MAHDLPVFHDPEGRRTPWVRSVIFTVLALVAALGVFLVVGVVLVAPILPRSAPDAPTVLPRAIGPLPVQVPAVPRPPRRVRGSLAALRRLTEGHPPAPGQRPQQMVVAPAPALGPWSAEAVGHPIAAAFYVNYDDSSWASLRRNVGALDWVIPAWVTLQDGPQPLAVSMDNRALDLIRRTPSHPRILPMVQNYQHGDFDGALVSRALADQGSRDRLVSALAHLVGDHGFSGVSIDLENIPDDAQPNLLAFMQSLHTVFATHGWLVTQAVPMDDDAWDYRAYAAASDYLLVMAYDQHWSTGVPGPVAGQDWYERTLSARLAVLDPAHVITCLGGYGYDWSSAPGETTPAEAADVTFQEAVLAARDHHQTIAFEPGDLNPHFQYAADDGRTHTLWFLDGTTAYNQLAAGRAAHVAGAALWRLGSEDPSVWSVFGRTVAAPHGAPTELQTVRVAYNVDFEGTGEVLQLIAHPQDGVRDLVYDRATDRVTSEQFRVLPTAWVIRRSGDRAGLVSLTFDDGPDPVYTPQILDILRREGVHASFFIIGENGTAHPDLVRRIVAEGHDIGNHTYTHPNLGEVPPAITDLELNATQRLIESLTGRSTVLFRPPYFGDAEPTTPNEVAPLAEAERRGYITIGLRIDPDDWAEPGTAAIVRSTLAQAGDTGPEGRGRVVLLHDGGGDRTETVAALPGIIRGLRGQGLRLVPVSELAGLSRDRAMPRVRPGGRDAWLDRLDWLSFEGLAVAGQVLHAVLVAGLALGFGRIAFITVLAVAGKFRSRRRPAAPAHPARASVLVPAYNEEKVIARTVESLLASDHPDFEILVIDDGSRDGTSRVVAERFGTEPRVRLFTKPNGGKADSLNHGIRHATGEIVVALDADTVFPRDVLTELTRDLADPTVGAVAGNAKVGNRINVVTRWQALEYITAQNLDRRAFALLNCITVVPGAVGAWRRDVIDRLGGFSSDTLAEDQDLTLKVLRDGYRVSYAEKAIAWTEAPDSLRTLARQRYRWSFGTLQCMWKHRGALLRPGSGTLGLVAMPNVWIFQVGFTLLAPFMDLLLLASIAWTAIDRLEHPGAGSFFTPLGPAVFYYALFTVVDVASAAVGFALERGEQWSLLIWLPLQRICYRQVLYYAMYRSVLSALHGVAVGWGKLERKATVATPP